MFIKDKYDIWFLFDKYDILIFNKYIYEILPKTYCPDWGLLFNTET